MRAAPVLAPRASSFELDRAYSPALGSARERRGRANASDRLLHSETIQLLTRASSLPGAVSPNRAQTPLGVRRGARSHTEARASGSSARRLSARDSPPLDSVQRKRARIGKLGAARHERGRGVSAFHGANTHFGGPTGERDGVVFRRAAAWGHLWHPCRGPRSGDRSRGRSFSARRPPRAVPRAPRERRPLSRSEMPSVGGRSAHRYPHGRADRSRRVRRSPGAHVMRIALSRRTALSSRRTATALARGGFLRRALGSRSRAPSASRAFDP